MLRNLAKIIFVKFSYNKLFPTYQLPFNEISLIVQFPTPDKANHTARWNTP